ncbi:universal stress protein [Halocalculus aciditolerans]|uniref:Universal stress protein UspA n=1 Tax=Halocalculus aciditolerans TaxID=1383812 RepID=A0A830FDA5_9EURY|nr:universal stress protein [Halocalculus aciditolerans]GGL63908.1 universal stress protein UspA [Halocalculus aciditolerans]
MPDTDLSYDDILVPTDGSGGTQPYLDQAIELATQHDARIHALYVVDTRVRSIVRDAVWPDVQSDIRVDADTAVKSIEGAAKRADVDAVTAVRTGIPHDEILAYADENDIDLIVMATHGRSGPERAALGSTTERVLRQAHVPVLTVRLDEHRRD